MALFENQHIQTCIYLNGTVIRIDSCNHLTLLMKSIYLCYLSRESYLY